MPSVELAGDTVQELEDLRARKEMPTLDVMVRVMMVVYRSQELVEPAKEVEPSFQELEDADLAGRYDWTEDDAMKFGVLR